MGNTDAAAIHVIVVKVRQWLLAKMNSMMAHNCIRRLHVPEKQLLVKQEQEEYCIHSLRVWLPGSIWLVGQSAKKYAVLDGPLISCLIYLFFNVLIRKQKWP